MKTYPNPLVAGARLAGIGRYHIEIFRDPHLQRLQDHANAYLAECEELNAAVEIVALQWLDDEYHLTITLRLPPLQEHA